MTPYFYSFFTLSLFGANVCWLETWIRLPLPLPTRTVPFPSALHDRSARLIERQYRCLYPIPPHSFDLYFLDFLAMDVSRLHLAGC